MNSAPVFTTTWLVAYDIADPRRLRRVERAVSAVGSRVHYSLFLCELENQELRRLQRRIARIVDVRSDTVRYIPWCRKDRVATRHLGTSTAPVMEDAWIV